MNKNLATIPLEQQQRLFDVINSTSVLSDKGALDVFAFGKYLAHALFFDGFDIKSTTEIIDMTLQLPTEEEYNQKLAYEVHINDMDDETLDTYPYGVAIYISPALLVNKIHHLVYNIGGGVLNIPRLESDTLYSWWVKREYVFTYAFFDKLFKDFTEVLSRIPEFNTSTLSLHIRRNTSNDGFSAEAILMEKDQRSIEINNRIVKAIKDHYYLEAIVLLESCFSDKLSILMNLQGKKPESKAFASLILSSKKFLPSNLQQEINDWRKERNKSVHNMVRSSIHEELESLKTLDEKASKAASDGLTIFNRFNDWFEEFVKSTLNPYHFRIPENKHNDA